MLLSIYSTPFVRNLQDYNQTRKWLCLAVLQSCSLAVLRSCGLAVLRFLPMYLIVRNKGQNTL